MSSPNARDSSRGNSPLDPREQTLAARAAIASGVDTPGHWATLQQLASNDLTRKTVLSELFADDVVGKAAISEKNQREKLIFFRDATFLRNNDDATIRNRIRGALLEPLRQFVSRARPGVDPESIVRAAVTTLDNLLFDATECDHEQLHDGFFREALQTAERWWQAKSTAAFRLVARALQSIEMETFLDSDASSVRSLISCPLAEPSHVDAKVVARIGLGYNRLRRQDCVLQECGSWLERRSIRQAQSPRFEKEEDADKEIELFARVGLTARGKNLSTEMAAFANTLKKATRKFYRLAEEDRLAELYVLRVNSQCVWLLQTFLQLAETPREFARTFWVGPAEIPQTQDQSSIDFVVLLARYGIKPEVACGLLENVETETLNLLLYHDGAEKVAKSLVSNANGKLESVLVGVAAQRLRAMVAEFPHLDTNTAYAAMVANECRRELDMAQRDRPTLEPLQAPIHDRSTAIARIEQYDPEMAKALKASDAPLRIYEFDDDDDTYYNRMSEAVQRLCVAEILPQRIWVHGTLRCHVPSLLQGISLEQSRPWTDFGRGFYLTDVAHVAEAARQGARVAERAPLGDMRAPDCAVVVYGLQTDDGGDLLSRFQGLRFDAPTPEWANVVRLCRTAPTDRRSKLALEEISEYKYLQGPVAIPTPGPNGTTDWNNPMPLMTQRGTIMPQLAIKSNRLAIDVDESVMCVFFFDRRGHLTRRRDD